MNGKFKVGDLVRVARYEGDNCVTRGEDHIGKTGKVIALNASSIYPQVRIEGITTTTTGYIPWWMETDIELVEDTVTNFKVGDVVNNKIVPSSKYTVKYASTEIEDLAYVFRSHATGKDYGIAEREADAYELWSEDDEYSVGDVLESVTGVPHRITRFLYVKLGRNSWLSISVRKPTDGEQLHPQRLTYQGMLSRAGTSGLVKVA